MANLKVGDRVVMTKNAKTLFAHYRSYSGWVVGINSLNKTYLRVRRDGIKYPETWFVGFWRKSK